MHFAVRSGSKTFDFKLDDCMCVDGEWMIGNGVFLMRRGARAPDGVSRPETVPIVPDPSAEAASEAAEAAAPVAVPEIERPRNPGR